MMGRAAFAAVCLGLAASAATAASPEDDYVAARDRAIAAVKRMQAAKVDDNKVTAYEEKASADLARRLEAILGPLAARGFPATAKLNLESLSDGEVGFGMLDGLVHAESDAGPRVVVTTRSLLARWLEAKAAESDKGLKLPAAAGAALELDLFYTEAIGADAAFSRVAELPIRKPAGADFALARLGGWAQDIGPNPSAEAIIALGRNGKVMIADAPLEPPLPKIAACDAVWAAATKESERLQAIYQKSNLKDQKAFDASTKAQDKGDSDYRACLAERLPKAPGFPAYVRQAQDIADRLAGK